MPATAPQGGADRVLVAALSPHFPKQQSQIIRRAFEHAPGSRHVAQSPQPTAPPSARLTDMRKGPFAPLAARPIQSLAFVASHPPAIGPKGQIILGGLVGPAAGLLFALGNICAHTALGALGQQPVVVIAFVGHHFRHLRLRAGDDQIGLGEDQAFGPGLRITAVGMGHVRTHDGLGLQIHGVLLARKLSPIGRSPEQFFTPA